MRTLHGVLGLMAICAILVLLSVAGLASDFLSRLMSNVDGLLLLMICLLMGVLFAFMLYTLLKESRSSAGSPRRAHSAPTAAPSSGTPATAASSKVAESRPSPPGGTPAPTK